MESRLSEEKLFQIISISTYRFLPTKVLANWFSTLREKTFKKIQQEFPELRKRYWVKHLWGVGYFVLTTGNVTDEMIKSYVEKEESRGEKFGDFKVEN